MSFSVHMQQSCCCMNGNYFRLSFDHSAELRTKREKHGLRTKIIWLCKKSSVLKYIL